TSTTSFKINTKSCPDCGRACYFRRRHIAEQFYSVPKYQINHISLTLVTLSGIGGHHLAPWQRRRHAEGPQMTASETGSPAWPSRLLEGGHSVSVVVATAIVVADMIGVGVFTSLGFQVKDIPSGFSILLLWTVGGLVALCGVFSYSE